ncbi:hypothetical protein AB4Z09_26020 [Rhodococcus sp. TAF43]|uniref:hypothetical protein n=1 Tax=Rhodococcus sp. TAF43 TaxID=3237483 RepID=UPI003F959F01
MTSDVTSRGTGEPIRPRKPTPRRFWRLSGVYPSQSDTHLLARTLLAEAIEPGTRVLDIGAGSGYLSVATTCGPATPTFRAGCRGTTSIHCCRRTDSTWRRHSWAARARW